jgi:arsenite methyltransferase
MSLMDFDIKKAVKEQYGKAAGLAKAGVSRCCEMSSSGCAANSITKNLYTFDEILSVPKEALLASLGCGNPTALAELISGEVVLDLGSGGGIDVLLSAKRVGPQGKVYGLDMTDEMLALARDNQRKAGVTNVEFLKGEIENIPLPDHSVDVIISNCVINLSGDKDRVMRESFRVLKPCGRFAVSDIVTLDHMPAEVRRTVELWAGCIAGALHQDEYRAMLVNAGFEQVEIEPTRVYRGKDITSVLDGTGLNAEAVIPYIEGKFASAFIRARKPAVSIR